MMTQSWTVRKKRKAWMAMAFLSFSCSFLAAALADEPKIMAPTEIAAPREFITHHKLELGKDSLSYVAVVGETIVRDRDGAPEASLFSIAYTQEGLDRPEARPITFFFNGGPGSTAVWLHLGAFGPRRIVLPNDPVNPGAPPYHLADNPDTLLRYSDLVFVDPIGTGYSHALGKYKDQNYWGVDEDSAVLAKFIRAYLTANKRWNSPKYLGGESYGTLRISVLIRDLELKPLDGVAFNGVILLSAALDVRTFLSGSPENELPYVIDLPTYAATAHYHGRLPQAERDFDAFLRRVQDFASSEYLVALFKGDSLPDNERDAITEKLHQYTGLSADYVKRCHLKVEQGRFLKELLRDRGLVMALHDTRYTGKDPDEAGDRVQNDPFLFGITGPFVASINSYLAAELGVKMEQPYTVFSEEAAVGWRRAREGAHLFTGFLNTTPHLAQAAATNNDFRVFVASGIHDLTTAFYGTQYVFDHSGISKDRVTLKNYHGGHMMYTHLPSLRQLSSDIGFFMKRK